MSFKKAFDTIMDGVDRVIGGLVFTGCVVYGIMALVVTANVIGRFAFHKPIKGTVELIEIMMVFVAFFSVAFTAKTRGHVTVRLFVHRFPKQVQKIVLGGGFFLSAVIFGVITYQAIVNTIYYFLHLEQTTSLLLVPLAPLKFVMALGCLILFIVLVLDFLHPMPVEKVPGEAK